ncbi:MAG: hypothetical protein HUU19_11145 [Phycisphaerales bacterium]|nr:hypothetical protein [Phycisphaerales bacterium]
MPDKICIICGEDCSRVARQKDAKGNYACQSCLDERERVRASRTGPSTSAEPSTPAPRQPSPPSSKPAPVDEDMSYDLLGDMPDPCGSCGAPLAEGVVVCMNCGYNAETGVKHNTEVQVAPLLSPAKRDSVEKDDDDDGEPRRVIVIHGGWAAGAVGVVMLVLFVLARSSGSDAMLGVYGLGVIGVSLLAAISSIVIPFQEDEAGWGIGLMLANGVAIARAFGLIGAGMGFGGLVAVGVTIYYAFAVSESRWLKGIVALNFLCMFSLFAFTGK